MKTLELVGGIILTGLILAGLALMAYSSAQAFMECSGGVGVLIDGPMGWQCLRHR